MQARLLPADDGPTIELTKELTLLGRDPACDIRLDHASVSKLHCVLVVTDGLILVRDLGSTNGTRVNGTRVRRAALLPNDWLMVAALRYRVTFGTSAGDAPDPPGPTELAEPAGSGDYPAVPPPADPVSGPAVARRALPDR